MSSSHGTLARRSRFITRHTRPSALGLTKLIKNLEIGSRAVITPRSTFRNVPHLRYRGRIGIVVEKRGDAYVVQFPVSKSKIKKIIVPQMHLERL